MTLVNKPDQFIVPFGEERRGLPSRETINLDSGLKMIPRSSGAGENKMGWSRGRIFLEGTDYRKIWQNPKIAGLLLILLNCLGISGKSIFIPLLYQAGMTGSEIVAGRLLYAVPGFLCLFFLLAPRQDRRFPLVREWRVLIGLNLLSMIPVVAHTIAYSMISSAVASVVVYVYPLFVVIFEWIILKKRPSRNVWIVIFIMYLGIVMLVCAGRAPLEVRDWTGIIYTITAALSFALYLVFQSSLSGSTGPLKFEPIGYCAWSSGIILVIVVPYVVSEIGGIGFLWQGRAVVLFAAFSVFSTVIPFVSLLYAIRLLGASTTALVTSITPAMTVNSIGA